MLEILISLLIIMIGVLGVAGIQLVAINNTTTVSYENTAAQLAAGISAQMQANLAYWGGAPTNIPAITQNTTALSGVDCINNVCTSTNMAAYDKDTWRNALVNNFPTSTATGTCNGASTAAPFVCITCQTATPVVCVIQLAWSVRNVAFQNKTQNQQTVRLYQTTVTIPQL